MEKIEKLLNKARLEQTVDSKDKSFTTVNSSNTVNCLTVSEKIDLLIKEESITPEGVAMMLAEGLDDQKSEKYFLLLAKNNNPGVLLEALSYTKDAFNRGIIRTKKIHYFKAILRNKGITLKFKKS